jgi:histone H3/H4
MNDKLVIDRRVKKRMKDLFGVRVDGDLSHALDTLIKTKLAEAVLRAKANGRNTVRPCDL